MANDTNSIEQNAIGNPPSDTTSSAQKPTATPSGELKSPVSTGGLIAGHACMLVAALFWGLNVSVTKALIPADMTADSITAVRLIGGAVLFWLASAFIKCDSIEKEDWLKIVLGGFIGLFGFIYLFITSLKYGNPIDISIIMTLPPIFVILIGIIFFKSRPGWMEYVGIIISFAGAIIVIIAGSHRSSSEGSNDVLGDLLTVASTLCYAFYLTILEKPTKKYKPVSLLRWVFLFAALPAIFLVPGMQHLPIIHAHKALPWIYIGFILLCPTFIAYFLVQPAIKRIGSELVSIYQYLLPVFATISAVLMKLAHLRWEQVIAMVVIVIGMLFTTFGKRRRVKLHGQDEL